VCVLGLTLNDIIHSADVRIALYLTIFTIAVFWLGLAYWVYRDARRRVGDPWLVGTSTLLGLVPFLGPLVYLLFRPPESLQEARAREVEIRALEARLAIAAPACPVCRSAVEASYLLCPVCTTQLKQPCATCSAPLEPLWQACPFCTAPITATPVAIDLDAALRSEAAHLRKKTRQEGRAAAS
jgi:hypothetical protein